MTAFAGAATCYGGGGKFTRVAGRGEKITCFTKRIGKEKSKLCFSIAYRQSWRRATAKRFFTTPQKCYFFQRRTPGHLYHQKRCRCTNEYSLRLLECSWDFNFTARMTGGKPLALLTGFPLALREGECGAEWSAKKKVGPKTDPPSRGMCMGLQQKF
jgi:hypothetical protein